MAEPTQLPQNIVVPATDDDIVQKPSVVKVVSEVDLAKAKVANRIFWAYILVVLLIILHFVVPIEVQHKYYLDIIYKSLGVISIAYIGFLTLTKDMC